MPEPVSNQTSAWATCSPINFRGCEIYANRDAGLVGQGLMANGLECKSILLTPSKDGDLPHIIRATRQEMENPQWWAGLVRNGVVFYNSSHPIHAPILLAAKAAGLPVAINVDNTAIFDFHSRPREFWQKSIMHKSHRSAAARLSIAFAGVLKSHYRKFQGRYRRLAAHLAIADVIGAVTPDAADRLRGFLANHGQAEAAARVQLIPHPVHPRFVTHGEKAHDGAITFVTVGRWDDRAQKRPDLLMQVIDALCARDPRMYFRIFGRLIPEMEQWHSRLEPGSRERVLLHGVVPNAELLEAYQAAHSYLCVSAYESFLIAAAEALCCGCSIVACESPTLPGPKWFASDSRGTLSGNLAAKDLTRASLLEAEAWRQGQRDSHEIAAWAQQNMHATHVAESYATLLSAVAS